MEAKELRIGNYVYLPINNNEYFQIEQGDFCSNNIADYSVAEFCQPIPLTEEWLLKFGAEKVTYDDGSGYYLALRHKDFNRVEGGANWLGKSLTSVFKDNVLGPTTPGISKIRNYYIRHLIIKIPQNQSLKNTKKMIVRVVNAFQAINEYRSIKLTIDVDNY